MEEEKKETPEAEQAPVQFNPLLAMFQAGATEALKNIKAKADAGETATEDDVIAGMEVGIGGVIQKIGLVLRVISPQQEQLLHAVHAAKMSCPADHEVNVKIGFTAKTSKTLLGADGRPAKVVDPVLVVPGKGAK